MGSGVFFSDDFSATSMIRLHCDVSVRDNSAIAWQYTGASQVNHDWFSGNNNHWGDFSALIVLLCQS